METKEKEWLQWNCIRIGSMLTIIIVSANAQIHLKMTLNVFFSVSIQFLFVCVSFYFFISFQVSHIFFSTKPMTHIPFMNCLLFLWILQSTPCKHPVIVLQDVAFNDLHALVEFIYHGEVNVHQRSLSSFLKTAEVLRVSGLTQQQAEETHNVSIKATRL